ncbi:MAG: hypothetical protein ACOY82_20725 [Pseudomonadota bacterium]
MTPRKSAPLLCSALLVALFATGCKQDAAEEAEAASTDAAEATADTATVEPAADAKVAEPVVAPTPVPGTDAAIIEEKASPTAAAPAFDAKAFEGSYAAGDTALEVTADGMFALSKGGSTVEGTWTLQPDGKTVTLDPDSKSDTDRSLEVVSKDSVKLDGATLARKQ